MMLTALFLVWLQMSAQPLQLREPIKSVSGGLEATIGCPEGATISIGDRRGKLDVIAKCHDGYYERVPSAKTLIDDRPTHRGIIQPSLLEKEFAEAAQRAADETDGKPPTPALPREGETVCWNDPPLYGSLTVNFTLPYRCMDSSGKRVYPYRNPVDVPAVQDRKLVVKKGDVAGDTLCRLFAENTDQNCRAVSDIYHSRYTCSDKSRVLLTSEDGKKHCVKF